MLQTARPPPNPPRRIPRAEAKAAYQQGASLASLSRLYGVSERRLRYLLQRLGVPLRTPQEAALLSRCHHHLPQAHKDAVVQAYQQGQSVIALSRQHHASTRTIENILRSQGVPLRSLVEAHRLRSGQLRRSPPVVVQGVAVRTLIDAYAQGLSTCVLAKTYGLSLYMVRKLLHGAGVQMRPASEAIRLGMQRIPPEKRRQAAIHAQQVQSAYRRNHAAPGQPTYPP